MDGEVLLRSGSADREDSPASPTVVGAVKMPRRVVGRADNETCGRADELEIGPTEISAAGRKQRRPVAATVGAEVELIAPAALGREDSTPRAVAGE